MTPASEAQREAVEAAIRERDKASEDIRLRGWRKDFGDVGTVQVIGDGSGDSIDRWMRNAVYAHHDRRDLLALLDAERAKVAATQQCPYHRRREGVSYPGCTCPQVGEAR